MVGPGFVEVYKWSSNVDHAEGSGSPEFEGAVCSERVCNVNVKGFDKISEELTKYNESNMNLVYAVKEGMPGFVTKAVKDWTVVAVDDTHSKLIMKAEFESKGLMGKMMNGMMRKKMAETGEMSQEKAERVAQLEKKMKKAA